ncbi:biopolymer transporter ExbD [Flavobacteriales bacterium]|jgi:biopolymer transport protein ExbD|nr:biopolymer transporter ExbD [Flavobacteriales bacterium]
MAKRELEEINAGSMADIAFLLLIFFLVTTTMNFPKVLEERLPQKIDDVIDPPLVKKENVLEILANKNDQILIEGNRGEIEDIKDKVIEFYVHDINSTVWPKLTPINESMANQYIEKFKVLSAQYPDDNRYADTLNRWKIKKGVVDAIGTYNEISDKAMITIQLDNATSFKTYVSVLNEIMAGINELRAELCLAKFGVPYNKIEKSKVPEDQAKVKILRAVYPKRIMKAKSKNSQG